MKTKARLCEILILAFVLCDVMYSEPMNVTATVENSCQIGTITDVDFGTVSGLFPANVDDSDGEITITCTPTSVYLLAIDAGQNDDATSRRMADGAEFIRYNLFQDAGFSTPWGDGTAFGDPLTGTGDGNLDTYPVYARIPAGQTPVSPGGYADIVNVTFSF